MGVLVERGCLRITDRFKDMFIVGGFNCYPTEIERMLADHPDVAQVAVIGIADERMGEVGRTCVVARHGVQVDKSMFIQWCREKWPTTRCFAMWFNWTACRSMRPTRYRSVTCRASCEACRPTDLDAFSTSRSQKWRLGAIQF